MPGSQFHDFAFATSRTSHVVLFIAIGVSAAGCESEQPTIVPVDGIVRIDGQPLRTGTIRFIPVAGRSARGQIQSDGSFQLGTYHESDGARVGVNGVSITAFERAAGNIDPDVDRPRSNSLIPLRYNSAAGSGLTFEVKPDGANHAEFDLTSSNR